MLLNTVVLGVDVCNIACQWCCLLFGNGENEKEGKVELYILLACHIAVVPHRHGASASPRTPEIVKATTDGRTCCCDDLRELRIPAAKIGCFAS